MRGTQTDGKETKEKKEKKEKKKRGFSLRSLSPWRRKSKKNEPPEFSNKKEDDRGRRNQSRSRRDSRARLIKTPSQMLYEEERRETSIPLVAVSASQDSSQDRKPVRKFSLRSLSPFSRGRSTRPKVKKNQKADPFYENDSL